MAQSEAARSHRVCSGERHQLVSLRAGPRTTRSPVSSGARPCRRSLSASSRWQPLLPARRPGRRRPSLGRRAVGGGPGQRVPRGRGAMRRRRFVDGAAPDGSPAMVAVLTIRSGSTAAGHRTGRKRRFGSGVCGIASGSTRRGPGFLAIGCWRGMPPCPEPNREAGSMAGSRISGLSAGLLVATWSFCASAALEPHVAAYRLTLAGDRRSASPSPRCAAAW